MNDSKLQAPERTRIRTVETTGRQVLVDWEDGHRSRFHHQWLRDNCFCARCGDTWTGKRFIMLTDFEADVHPSHAECDAHGRLVIHWDGEPHRSVYEPFWLRRHCYSKAERERRRFRPNLWDASMTEQLPTVDYPRARADRRVLFELYGYLRDFGIVRVREVPADEQGSRSLGELIGVLQDYGYGEIQDIASVVDYSGELAADVEDTSGTYQLTLPTNNPIPPHTDQLFHYAHPGIIFFHCVEPNPQGGGASVMVDGFRVVEDLRAQAPDAFALLSTVPQMFTRHIPEASADIGGFGRGVDFRGGGRAICLNTDGDVVGFRYHSRATAPLDVPEALMEPLYAANRELVSRLNDEHYQVRFTLAAGEAVILDNHRVLHAREGFSGRRHLRLFQVGREEFHNRLRMLANELGDESADWLLPGGALG